MADVGVLSDVEIAQYSAACHYGIVHGVYAKSLEVFSLEML